MAKNDYIESLDIPDFDKRLLYQFEDMDWADIYPSRCISEKGRQAARDIMRTNRCRDEHRCGIG